VRLSNSCKKQLEAAEGRIQVLIEPEGRAVRMTDLEIEDEDLDVEADEDEE